MIYYLKKDKTVKTWKLGIGKDFGGSDPLKSIVSNSGPLCTVTTQPKGMWYVSICFITPIRMIGRKAHLDVSYSRV
jgi:hypothetical protein